MLSKDDVSDDQENDRFDSSELSKEKLPERPRKQEVFSQETTKTASSSGLSWFE